MILDSDHPEKSPLLWEVVPLADYRLPVAPVTQHVKERLALFRRLFRRDRSDGDTPIKAHDKLRALAGRQLEWIAPVLDWRASADALDRALGPWLAEAPPARPITVIVGPPYSGHEDTLRAWTARNAWRSLRPPTTEQILSGDEDWLSGSQGDADPWVLPNLEHVYLRHAAGLTLIRRFLDHAFTGRFGRGIIGCDSWAWTYLSRLWRGRSTVTMALQAFDRTRLAQVFQRPLQGNGAKSLVFRQSDNGHFVVPQPALNATSSETSGFLSILAATSRGIIGVARELWLTSMRTEPDQKMAETDDPMAWRMADQTIWIVPWKQLVFPSLPGNAGRNEAFVLHALLLHNGLTMERLQQLLSLEPASVVESISRLADCGLLDQDEANWRVTARGYPAVRQFLQSRGYLVDPF